jgi:molecular chaperone IbpA
MLTLIPAFGATRTFAPAFDLFDDFGTWRDLPTYPDHSFEQIGRDRYRLTVAVPGFAENELSVEASDRELTVRGRKNGSCSPFTANEFELRTPLAEHMRVTGAHLANGLLTIELARELPDALKPRVIPIRGKSAPRLALGKVPAGESMIAKLRRVLTGQKAA